MHDEVMQCLWEVWYMSTHDYCASQALACCAAVHLLQGVQVLFGAGGAQAHEHVHCSSTAVRKTHRLHPQLYSHRHQCRWCQHLPAAHQPIVLLLRLNAHLSRASRAGLSKEG